MPFDAAGLQHIGAGAYRYRTRDDATAVNAPGYWTAAWPTLRRGDAIFRTTFDVNGQVASHGRHVITAAARTAVSSLDGFGSGGVITPLPPGAQVSSISWTAGSRLAILANAAPGGELVLNSGRHDHRADRPATITTADADVSTWASGQSLPGTVTQGTLANRPTHSQAAGVVAFTGSTGPNDTTNGRWLGFPTGAGTLPTRFEAGSALGMVYMLVRFATVPTWRTRLFGVGTLTNTFQNERRGYGLDVNAGGQLRFWRADATTVSAQTIAGAITANEPIALAFVMNDDRTTPGVSDNVTRCYVLTKPAGPYPTMTQAATAARAVANNSSPIAMINRDWYTAAAAGIGNFELIAFAADYAPPTTDTPIQDNLSRLIGRM